MLNCNQIVNITGEKVVTKAGSKSFLRRFAEKIGLVQREVAECRGKSLSEMAEMTSKKDVAEFGNHSFETVRQKYNSAVLKRERYISEGQSIRKSLEKYEQYVSDTKKELEQVQDLYTLQRKKIEQIKKNGRVDNTYNDYNYISGDCYERGYFETVEGFKSRLANEEQKLKEFETKIRTLRNRLNEEESLLEKYNNALEKIKHLIDDAFNEERALYGEIRNLEIKNK